MQSGWSYGECERTGAKGDFPAECVYVLPAITKPPPEILVSTLPLIPLMNCDLSDTCSLFFSSFSSLFLLLSFFTSSPSPTLSRSPPFSSLSPSPTLSLFLPFSLFLPLPSPSPFLSRHCLLTSHQRVLSVSLQQHSLLWRETNRGTKENHTPSRAFLLITSESHQNARFHAHSPGEHSRGKTPMNSGHSQRYAPWLSWV